MTDEDVSAEFRTALEIWEEERLASFREWVED